MAHIIGLTVLDIEKNELIKKLTYNDLVNNHLLFNKILKQKCKQNNILYFDLIDECSYNEDNITKIKEIFLPFGDHHYKGCGASDHKIKIDPDNYINNEEVCITYHTFIKKLIESIE